MKNLRDINFKLKYRSSDDDIVNNFYIPALKNSYKYKRAVGYFSSSALIDILKGIRGLVENEGKILIIASPFLHKDDIEAIDKGYEKKKKIINKVLIKNIYKPKNYFEEERLNLLAHLIANNVLKIRIALFQMNNSNIGLYHEKFGLIYDENENIIAFTGSLNESTTAFKYNFESIDVFCSWRSKNSLKRIREKEKDFKKLWCNETNKLDVVKFPKAVKEKLLSYKKPEIDWSITAKKSEVIKEKKREQYLVQEKAKFYPKIPNSIELYDYQKRAVDSWVEKEYQGIFDMATGTGKTYTGLAAVVRLFEDKNKLAIIIVCPYQHLVEQWIKDVEMFNMRPIIGYSNSNQKNWKQRLKDAVIDYNLDIKDYFCLVTTNATFANNFVQSKIEKIDKNILLIGDEAHNLGATNIRKKLHPKIQYRLALSATIIRHRDEQGTDKLLNYFGERCIKYSLRQAIKEEKLTEYYYHPILVNLGSDELEKYKNLTKKLTKCFKKGNKSKNQLTKLGKKIAIKRARLVAGASNKLLALKNKIKNYKNQRHILIYCGATTVQDVDYKFRHANNVEVRQIEAVSNLLGNELDMKVSQFTSEEDSSEREVLKKEFSKGETLQALVAIRCLDEGVNIPKVKTAFILASSTNPKEYIQRRGRVLRLANNKNYSEIFDFVTIPRPLSDVKNLPIEKIKIDKSLVKKEIKRVEDFSNLAINPQKGLKLVYKLKKTYNLDRISGGEIFA